MNLTAAYTRRSCPHTPIRKYIGINIASQKMKKRKRSRETKTPIIPVSSASRNRWNSFTRVVIPDHEASTASGVRNAVSSVSRTLKPSTPTW